MVINTHNAYQFDNLDPIDALAQAWISDWPAGSITRAELKTAVPVLFRCVERVINPRLQGGLLAESLPPEPEPESEPEPEAEGQSEAETDESAIGHLLDDGATPQEAEDGTDYDVSDKTIEQIGERARIATERLRNWGRRRGYRDVADREAQLRLKLVVHLNARDGVTQKVIAEMLGLSTGRITQLVSEYYDRLEYEQAASRQRR